jgi:hypothetical protein
VVYYQLLDLVLGKDHDALFRRAELKTLVDLHGNEVLFSYFWIAKLQSQMDSYFIVLSINMEPNFPISSAY